MRKLLFIVAGLLALAPPALAQVTVNCQTTNTFVPSCYNLGQFAATTSAQLRTAISDETGSGGGLVFATGPTISAPILTGATTLPGIDGAVTLPLGTSASTSTAITTATVDATDASRIVINGGGAASPTRGGFVSISGNENTASGGTGGDVKVAGGSISGSGVYMYNGTTEVAKFLLAGATLSGTLTASALTVSAGTPNSICQDNSTKEITVNAALTCTVSSARFKDSITPFKGSGLRMVAAMKPDTFFYKDRLDRNRIGLVAEDLAAIDPRLSEWDQEGRPNSIDFPALAAVLIKAVQEQQSQIAALQREVKALRPGLLVAR